MARHDADPFHEAKLAASRYYCGQVLPTARGLVAAVTAGAGALPRFSG